MSHNDKRSVATDALETLGMVHPSKQYRDAIHLAVEPVVAGEILQAGDHIGYLADGRVGKATDCVLGIVDPFIEGYVTPGQEFWLVVYPRKITSLRHVWSHPAFPETVDVKLVTAFPMPDFAAQDPVLKPFSVPNSATPWKPVDTNEMVEESRAVAWIQKFAANHSLDYEELMESADSYLQYGEYLTKGGDLEGCYVPDEFWDNYQVVKGKKVEENDRGSFFSCSC